MNYTPRLDFALAVVNGVRRGYLEHMILVHPSTSGAERQEAIRLDAAALNYSDLGRKVYKSFLNATAKVLRE